MYKDYTSISQPLSGIRKLYGYIDSLDILTFSNHVTLLRFGGKFVIAYIVLFTIQSLFCEIFTS